MEASRLGWRIENLSRDEADLYIFDVIGDPWGEGTTAAAFVKELAAVKASKINVYISSPGGYVSDALAIYQALRMHPANVTAYIVSVAASAASFVAMAANTVSIAKNAQMFIHDAHAGVFGDAEDARAAAVILDEESQNIASIYAEKAGGTTEDWRKAMQARNGKTRGTTYRGQEAVDAGLADEVTPVPVRAEVSTRIAALAQEMAPKPEPGSPAWMPEGLGAAWRDSASFTPKPTLAELLAGKSLKEGISAASAA